MGGQGQGGASAVADKGTLKCQACLRRNPQERPSSFKEIADALEELCPENAALDWGKALWKEQSARFATGAHANHHTGMLCKSGLEVLVSRRQALLTNRNSQAEALLVLASQYCRLGFAMEGLKCLQSLVIISPEMIVYPEILGILGKAYGDLGDVALQVRLLQRTVSIQECRLGDDLR